MQKHRFISAEDGAVTIDWVALAAGLLILGVGIISLFTNEIQTVVDEIEVQLSAAATFDPGFDNGEGGGEDVAGNGLVPGATYDTGLGPVAGPGDYYADFSGDGQPGPGDLFVIDNGDGTYDEVDGVNGDIIRNTPAGDLDIENGTYTDGGKGTFAVTQLQ